MHQHGVSLAVSHPNLAKEAYGWDPTQVTHGSGKKLSWICPNDHVWDCKVSNRTLKGYTCTVCKNKKLIVGLNDLRTTHPELAQEAHDWDPGKFMAGSTLNQNWKCSKGHTWIATITSRAIRKTGCPVCSNKKIEPGFNDLQTFFPEIANEANGWDPTLIAPRSGKKVSWKCAYGHVWDAVVSNRTRKNYGCPVCANKLVLAGFNDLATSHPEIAKEANGWDPRTVIAGNNNRFSWKCSEGHIWEIPLVNRTSRKTGCPVCSNQKLLVGYNDLKTSHPEIASEAYGWNPATVVAGSEVVKVWICKLGHQWKAMVYERTYKKFGCRICSGRELLTGFNDLQSRFPEIAAEADGWDPKNVTSGSGAKLDWKCLNGHSWNAEVSRRTSAGTGCPSCGKYGYSSSEPGWLYLLKHEQWEMLQIGITNFPNQRIASHEKLGWKVIDMRGPMDGQLVRDWETSILQYLKHHGADLGNDLIAGKFDGYSEAWVEKSFEVESLGQLFAKVHESEN